MKTDEFIQDMLKYRMKDKTILTIAHRLNTVADYDKIIVMKEGKIVQMGRPYELLVQNVKDEWITNKGYFAQMVKNTK